MANQRRIERRRKLQAHEPQLRQERFRDRLLARPGRAYPVSDHCDGRRFFNPVQGERPLTQVFTWLRTRKPSRWPGWVENPPFPPPRACHSPQLRDWRATFVNHATVLLQVGPYNLLTDPVWSERVSPFRTLGPRRVRAAGVALADLPRIDVVLLSHNHYDHLDLATLQYLARRDKPLVVTGLGNAPLLEAHGIRHVSELDRWEHVAFRDLRIHFTPAQHFSGRGLRDRDMTLWGGLYVESAAGGCFFAGDTGYGPHFAAIRERLGAPRLALLPIGAYEPYWFMGPVHMNPDDAVRAHLDLGARASLAIHFNTFQLTDEPIGQPVEDLGEALLRHGVDASGFLVLKEGEGRST
jgi:L-ascorbate metabolism protein UlaG (beta-lactamase superfamily)